MYYILYTTYIFTKSVMKKIIEDGVEKYYDSNTDLTKRIL